MGRWIYRPWGKRLKLRWSLVNWMVRWVEVLSHVVLKADSNFNRSVSLNLRNLTSDYVSWGRRRSTP